MQRMQSQAELKTNYENERSHQKLSSLQDQNLYQQPFSFNTNPHANIFQNDLSLLIQQQQLLGQAFPHFMQTTALQQELVNQLQYQTQMLNKQI
jgi:hypothetical protein